MSGFANLRVFERWTLCEDRNVIFLPFITHVTNDSHLYLLFGSCVFLSGTAGQPQAQGLITGLFALFRTWVGTLLASICINFVITKQIRLLHRATERPRPRRLARFFCDVVFLRCLIYFAIYI